MRKITKHLIFLSLATYLLIGCVKQEKVNTTKAMETTEIIQKTTLVEEVYGQHTDEIQEFLSNTPMGSEIYLEQKESGEWYLKVEKTFTVQKDQEETKIIEPIYGESILI